MLLVTLLQWIGLAASPLSASYLTAANEDSEMIRKYLNAAQVQDTAQRGVAMEVTIEARLPKLNRQATLRTLRRVSRTGKITYETLDASGDGTVRREVIARYLSAESQERETDGIAITPSHYRFRLAGTVQQAGRRIHIFELTPKKKQVGLFRGELWVDGQTGLPVHESGQFVKSPSVFIKRIVFASDYETRNGLNIPAHISSTVESRIAGRAELDIYFSNPCQSGVESAAIDSVP
jgi:hypothetical protein